MTRTGRRLGGLVIAAWAVATAASADPYAVADVAVDETAADAATARDVALEVGQRAAWATLVRRLLAPEDVDRGLALDAAVAGRLVRSFEVTEEKVAPDRYIARLTYRFDGAAVRRAFQAAGITRVAAESPPVLVLAVIDDGIQPRLFELDNPWRDAWQTGATRPGLVPIVVPLGDLTDIATIDAALAIAGDAAAIAAVAARYGTGSIAVAVARVAPSGELPSAQIAVVLTVHRGRTTNVDMATYTATVGTASLATATGDAATGAPDVAAADPYTAAVAGTLARLEESWRAESLVDTGVNAALTVEVPVAALADWRDVERRLAAVGLVREVVVNVMGVKAFTLTLTYGGDEARLASALGAAGLDLAREADLWVLRRVSG
ncbi:MAG: DUF2066 domain-containing protein, partial [Alphaproteobacteria bacterium]